MCRITEKTSFRPNLHLDTHVASLYIAHRRLCFEAMNVLPNAPTEKVVQSCVLPQPPPILQMEKGKHDVLRLVDRALPASSDGALVGLPCTGPQVRDRSVNHRACCFL